MEIKGKTSSFKKMIDVASLKGMFSELAIEVHNDKCLMIKCADGAGKIAASLRGIFTGFDVIKSDDKLKVFGIKVSKILKFMKFFDDDEDITFTNDGADLLIAGEQYVFTTAILDPDAIKVYAKEFSIPIDEEKKVALYKKGELQPTTIANVNSEVLKSIADVAVEIGQEHYPISIEPPNKIYCKVGSRKKDKTNDIAEFNNKQGDVLVEGEPMGTTLGYGFKEVCSVLDGEVQLSGVHEQIFKKQAPIWIYNIRDDYEIGFFLAPKVPE